MRGGKGDWLAWGGYLAVAAGALLAACGGVPFTTPAAEVGVVRVTLAGGGACHEHLYLTLESLRFRPADAIVGWVDVPLPQGRRVDLGAPAPTGPVLVTTLPAGHYDAVQLRLRANAGNHQLANAVQERGGALVALQTRDHATLPTALDVRGGVTTDVEFTPDTCRAIEAGRNGQPLLLSQLTLTQRVQTVALGVLLP